MATQRRSHGVCRERQRRREDVSPEPESTLGSCQARIETGHPCPYPAAMKTRGEPLRERHAREQEAYFAIGELTQGWEKKGGGKVEPLRRLGEGLKKCCREIR